MLRGGPGLLEPVDTLRAPLACMGEKGACAGSLHIESHPRCPHQPCHWHWWAWGSVAVLPQRVVELGATTCPTGQSRGLGRSRLKPAERIGAQVNQRTGPGGPLEGLWETCSPQRLRSPHHSSNQACWGQGVWASPCTLISLLPCSLLPFHMVLTRSW